MISYFLSSCWGFFILLSCIGWGFCVERALLPGQSIDGGQRAAWGISWAVFVGGVLNLTCLISPAAIWVFLGLGFFLWVQSLADTVKYRDTIRIAKSQWGHVPVFRYIPALHGIRKDNVALAALILVCLLAGLQYFGWVSSPNSNWHDDYQAYFVFPKKMLQAGCLGPDPFSERRVTSALGGMSFLDAFVLCARGEKNYHIMDSGVGLLIAMGVLWGYLKEKEISRRTGLAIVGLLLLCPPPRCNITALVLPVALFLSIFRWMDRKAIPPGPWVAHACLIALPTAALCALKSTFLPTCALLLILYYAFAVFQAQERRKAFCEFSLAIFLTVLLLLPWMAAEHQAFGTWLYPFLGKGFYSPVGGSAFAPWGDLMLAGIFLILGGFLTYPHVLALTAMAILAIGLHPRGADGRSASAALFVSVVFSSCAIYLANMGGNERYFFPMTLPATLAFLVMALGACERESTRNTARIKILITLVVGIWIAFQGKDFKTQCEMNVRSIEFGLWDEPLIPTGLRRQYQAMQRAIPPGQTVLTRLAYPFLLDFKRNTIYVADYPGAMTMRKGMPFFQGPEALANYFHSLSIRYVAYSYGNEANFQKAVFESRRSNPLVWHRTALNTIDFQDNLRKLGDTHKKIYDDGENFILDLRQKRAAILT